MLKTIKEIWKKEEDNDVDTDVINWNIVIINATLQLLEIYRLDILCNLSFLGAS